MIFLMQQDVKGGNFMIIYCRSRSSYRVQ